MSLARTVGNGIAWNTLAAAVGKCVVLCNLFLILRALSVYEYGLSELVMSVVSMMSIVLLPGLGNAVIADIAHEKSRGENGDPRSILLQFFLLNAVLGIAAWAVLFFGAEIAARLVGNPTISSLLKIVSFFFLLSPMRMVSTVLATVEKRFADQAFFGVTEELCKLFGVLYFIVFLGRTIDGLLFAAVVGQLAAIVIFIPRTISAFSNLAGGAHPYRFWEILQHHRKWSVAGTYVSSLTQTIQIWLIRLVLGTEAVGIYAVAAGILSQVSALLPLGSILAPIVPAYVHMKDHMRRVVMAAVKLQTCIAVALYFVAIALLPFFVMIFPKYESAAWLVPILLTALIPLGYLAITTPVFAAFKEQRSFVVSSVLKLIVTIILFPIGMLLFGLGGLAVANVCVLSVSAYERWFRLAHTVPEMKTSFRDMFRVSDEEKQQIQLLIGTIRTRVRLRGIQS